MKKLLFGALAALALLGTSCSKTDNGVDSQVFSKEASDSLLISLGQVAGANFNSQLTNAMVTDSTLTKQDFLKGLQYAMAADTSRAYIYGVQAGLQMLNTINHFQQMGVDVNPTVMLNAFKEAMLSDSVPSQFELQQLDSTFRVWADSLERAKEAHEIAVLEASAEAQENLANGKQYIADLQSKNPAVKVSDSGLAYVIIEQGEGEKVNPNDKVCLTYTAKTIDGRVIEQRNNQNVYISQRPDGFKEGVSLLNVGGKAVLYIPGNICYGVKAPQRLGIGPNEMVIYEIEVVEAPEAAPAQAVQPVAPGRPVRK